MVEASITLAAASRPLPGETVNGDAWAVDWHDGSCRIAIIDGLGHGPNAADASKRAVGALHEHPDLRPDDALRLCHHALNGTRGAAIAVALISWEQGNLTYAGIGNTEAILWTPDKQSRLIAHRGIVGRNIRHIQSFDMTLPANWLLIMHSDGVSQHMDLRLPPPPDTSLQALADRLLAQWGRATDDATLLMAAPSAAFLVGESRG